MYILIKTLVIFTGVFYSYLIKFILPLQKLITMNEIWITIKDFENYQVSNLGRIMSLYKNIILKPLKDKHGYYHISLYKNKTCYTKDIHIIVARTFISNPLNLPEVNHIDGNKENCAATNLEWSTKSDNEKHAYRTGLRSAKGEKNNQSKLTDIQVKEIKELKGKIKGSEVAIMYDIDRSVIYNIFNNKAWKHI
jgi:hypothetical protein